jgi:hypothetical protein
LYFDCFIIVAFDAPDSGVSIHRKVAGFWSMFEPVAVGPAQWSGWSGGKRFALVLTHDVDTAEGNEKVPLLMEAAFFRVYTAQ